MRCKLKFLVCLVLAALLMSCGGYRLYVNQEADFGFYKKIGVLPFSNLSGDRNASDKVTSSLVTELLIDSHVDIVPMGDMLRTYRNVIKDERTNLSEQITVEEAAAIGKEAAIQAIMVGVVSDYSLVRSGQEDFPLVSVSVRLVDCQSGKIVWTYECTERGGPKFPVFSFGETHTLGNMTSKICRKIAKAFSETLR